MKHYQYPQIQIFELKLESLIAISDGNTFPENIRANRSVGTYAGGEALSNKYSGIWGEED